MNIHEHQAKDLLREFGVAVPRGIVIYNIDGDIMSLGIYNCTRCRIITYNY